MVKKAACLKRQTRRKNLLKRSRLADVVDADEFFDACFDLVTHLAGLLQNLCFTALKTGWICKTPVQGGSGQNYEHRQKGPLP